MGESTNQGAGETQRKQSRKARGEGVGTEPGQVALREGQTSGLMRRKRQQDW